MIKPVDEIPGKPREKTQLDMLRQDIMDAWENGISRFEFDGNYNWKYAAGYARNAATDFFRGMVRTDYINAVKRLYPDEKSWWRMLPNPGFMEQFFRIVSRSMPDRTHVYCELYHMGDDYMLYIEKSAREAVEKERGREAEKTQGREADRIGQQGQ